MSILGAVAQEKPELLMPHLEVLRSCLDDMTTASQALMIFGNIAASAS